MRSTLAFALLPMLGLALMMTGCATRSTGDSSLTAAIPKLCNEAWLPISYSSTKDTPETVEGVRANNRAREAFCK